MTIDSGRLSLAGDTARASRHEQKAPRGTLSRGPFRRACDPHPLRAWGSPVTDRPTLPPWSNRLSDAPSAGSEEGDRASFCQGQVKAGDLSTVFQPIVHLDGGQLFFNLHPDELTDRWLVRPDDPIFSHDHDIYLEITESVPLTHFDLCMSVLREVCGRTGAHLVIDDLGAGYSNLKLIADLEPKVVKLDRALVQDLHRSTRHQKLVAMVVHLCHELGAAVVAEGIETRDELSAVSDCGAQYGQGYLLGRPSFPMPAVTWPPPPGESERPTIPPPRGAGP
jgi:hypothetical protein